jgi:hypothetical protein
MQTVRRTPRAGADRRATAQSDEQDENGKYIFSGSKGDVAPFSRNTDGTYSYNGDQVTLICRLATP